MEKIDVCWNDNMSFESELNGHKLIIDAKEEVGGENKGPRPKPLLLLSLGGCTGMDVLSMLKKMRVEFDDFNLAVSAEASEGQPVYYKKIHIDYEFWGKDLESNRKKIEKAVKLSKEKYCGVSYMLKSAAELSYDIKLHEK